MDSASDFRTEGRWMKAGLCIASCCFFTLDLKGPSMGTKSNPAMD